jgi:hypothetical protein
LFDKGGSHRVKKPASRQGKDFRRIGAGLVNRVVGGKGKGDRQTGPWML